VINGDDVTDTVQKMIDAGEEFPSLMTGKPFKEWGHDITCA